jgi:hypothetical protein
MSDYCRFSNLKEHLKGRKFSSFEDATLLHMGGLQHNENNFSWMG